MRTKEEILGSPDNVWDADGRWERKAYYEGHTLESMQAYADEFLEEFLFWSLGKPDESKILELREKIAEFKKTL